MNRALFHKGILLLCIIYVAALILLNIVPLGCTEEVHQEYILGFRADYLVHTLFFLPWTWLCCTNDKKSKQRIWLWVGVVLAISVEGAQYFIPYRGFNFYDMGLNVIGLFMGYLLLFIVMKKRKFKQTGHFR